jgi:hypothetical protein
MTTKTILAAAALLGLSAGSWAATAKVSQGSTITLEGKSTLHPFESVCKEFSLDLTVPGDSLAKGIEAQAQGGMTVKIPVACLKSEHSGLDKNLQKALNAKENPDIVFLMKGYKLEKDSGASSVVAWGDLTVAGKSQAETLKGSLSAKDGRTVIDGEQPLLMTDFGVKPPTMMMGAVKTENRVVVKFHLELEPAADAAQRK